MSPLIELVGYAGAGIGAGAGIPQTARAIRVGVAGVSATTYQIALASALMWIAYGFALGDWPQIPGNVIGAVCGVLILRSCWRNGQSVASLCVVAIVTLAAGIFATAIGGPTFLGWFGGALSCSLRLPQIRAAVVSPQVYGVSSLSWGTTIVSNLCWFIYGLGHSDPRILFSTALNIAGSYAIVQIIAIRRRRPALAVVA